MNIPSIPTISIVDDDESVREALENLLQSLGYTTEVFASGEDFLRSDHYQQSKCLILDIRMPGMSGFELERRLFAAGLRIPIIFISAHGDEEARAPALRERVVAFLRKPFSETALLSAVESALQE
ncbi:MAG TPA: response regulator [Anaerolineales bacterium]|nr:response regulator [Anaerolineales bacterium]